MTVGARTAQGGDVVDVLVEFGRAARVAGLPADPGRVQTMVAAAGRLDAANRRDVYWAGRVTLCGSPDDVERYDRLFAAYFDVRELPVRARRRAPEVTRTAAVPAGSDAGGTAEPADPRAATASAVEVLRNRDVAGLTEREREEVRRLLAALSSPGAVRRSRRRTAARRGDLDRGRTVRAMFRGGGEPTLRYRSRRERPRRTVLLIDISGSMVPYADALLRFAHAAARRRPSVEVFTLGTRLTRISRELRHHDPERSLAAVSAAVPDWSGGTRLGEQLKAFLDRWGQRGQARGAVVVVASDGWERGDASLLGEQMARLHRLAHRVVWANPHKARPGYEPLTAGIVAALPHVDAFVEGHSVAALEHLARVVAGGADA